MQLWSWYTVLTHLCILIDRRKGSDDVDDDNVYDDMYMSTSNK